MRHLPFIVLAFLLGGCQCFAEVSVSGSIQQGIQIYVKGSSSRFSKRPSLYDLDIHERGTENSGPMWQIKGKAKVSSITYGVAPTGMSEDAPARVMRPGQTYDVSVDADTDEAVFGLPCHGRATFRIDNAGNVVACSKESSACG
jgi:hypothetical protein